MSKKWFKYFCILMGILFISGILYVNNKTSREEYSRIDFKVWKEIVGDKGAYAFFYDKEPAGTRRIKDSDQIIRSNFHSLKNHFDVEHSITPGTYSAAQAEDYDETGAYGHHKEGSARAYWSSSEPASNEEGRLWQDSDDDVLYIADDSGTYQPAQVNKLAIQTANINLGGYRILMAATPPTSGQELATKSYVDSVVGAGGAHAASHTDGTDDIQSATDSQKGVMTAADHTLFSHGIIGGVYPVSQYTSGSTTDGIQEAIDAANTAGGGTVWLAAGDYTIESAITLYSNIVVEGDGWDTIVASTNDLNFDIIGTKSSAYHLESATINQNIVDCSTSSEAGNFSAGDLVSIEDGDGVSYKSFYIVQDSSASTGTITLESNLIRTYDTANEVIYKYTPSENVIIENIYFKDINVEPRRSRNVTIEGCKFGENTSSTDHIYVDDSYGINILDTFFEEVNGDAIQTNVSQAVLITNNIVHRPDRGINIGGSWEHVITNNRVKGATSDYGISLTTAGYSSIANNIIQGAADDNIYLSATSDSNAINGNVCHSGTIDNDGSGNIGAGNVYLTCEGCTWN